MRRSILVFLVATLALSSCGWRDSRINPRNWFGNSREVRTATVVEPTNPLIPRRSSILERAPQADLSEPIATVTEMRIEPTNSGAILYASGVARRQGAYQARLVPANSELIPDEDGVLSFSFRVVYPQGATPTGSEHSRTVHEAFSLSHQALRGIRTIRVEAAQNARESRRR
ncbi:hypothetical protein [Arenibacterium halophilum]|jgi:hypothetical protein|uniref:Lipoprotein n=1 Tax=Arenibacterium halophilum TaxID=2583821 RepID=A0ABY2XAH5_9RHOB|nr:hypothetical protein [Arenibacterium halophilum]MAY86810.1 hypothetical protein [Pseudooceanicola sp.]TMV13378.1 hypothetical protein FGK64_11560 [Arenibacterium halophilum]